MSQPYHHGALRTALIDAAENILERDGIEALTLRATARQAGVSHAAPTHHFGDLTGLLTALAATGFVRFREHMEAEQANVPDHPRQRLMAIGRAYVAFAAANPGLFLLMFRSERLDWCSPALLTAGTAAFALLTQDQSISHGLQALPQSSEPADSQAFQNLVKATARWSLMHGLATLLVDGRLAPTAQKVPGVSMQRLIEEVLEQTLGAEKNGLSVSGEE